MLVRSLLALVGCVLALLSLAGCNGASSRAADMLDQNPQRGFLTRTLGNGRQYVVFLPANYSAAQKYPMIVFLHGVGEGGTNVRKPITVGLGPFVAERATSFDFICIFPQSDSGGWDADSADAANAIAAIEDTCRAYSVDRDRISLTGLSTGGYGTWAIGARYSTYFSALVPMCANSAYTANSETLAKMPIWAFENAADPFVIPFSTQASVGAVRSAGGNVKHTVYPFPGHDCWDVAYANGEIFEWLKQQRRGSAAMASSAAPTRTVAPAPKAAAAKTPEIVPAVSTPQVPEIHRDNVVIPPTVY